MRTRRFPTTLALPCVLLLASVPVLAQTQFASFTGTVSSRDGNPIPDVEVVATNQATQVAYRARSNASASGRIKTAAAVVPTS